MVSIQIDLFQGFYDTVDAGFIDEHGHVYVMVCHDDDISVAGHCLSTEALEDVVLSHPNVGDAAVIGVTKYTKGEIPFCLVIMKQGVNKMNNLN